MILVKTPLRISLIGGGTDMEYFYSQYPGRVISTTIDKYIYITVSEKFEGDVRVSYSQTEMVPTRHEIKNTRAKAVMEKLGIEKGIQVVSIGDMPGEGVGLASSSAFTVGLLNGLHTYKGEIVTSDQLAQEACNVEIDMVGEPIGKQDQYAVAYGGMNLISFGNPTIVEKISYSQTLEDYFMFFYTAKTHPTYSLLNVQKSNSLSNFENLKHMSDMVPVFHEMLNQNDVSGMGRLLHESWLLKKELAHGISDEDIDAMYAQARQAGALGGKILGAGGGGFLMVLVEPHNRHRVRQSIPWQEVKFSFTKSGSEIVYET